MSNILKIGVIGLFLFLLSCNKNKDVDATLKIGEITEIKLGETVKNSEYGLSLQVENINDSRCPINAICVWAGEALVKFQLATKEGKCNFTLKIPISDTIKNDTIVEGVKYQLMDVLPYPGSNDEQQVQKVKILVAVQ